MSGQAEALIREATRAGADQPPARLETMPRSVARKIAAKLRTSNALAEHVAVRIWWSEDLLVQIFSDADAVLIVAQPLDGRELSWDAMMQIKRTVGYGHLEMVEVYPAETGETFEANGERHLVFGSGQRFAEN